MSFGSSTPIAVRVVGTDLKMVRQHAEKIAGEMKQIPFLRDVQFEQTLDYPTVEVDIDREKAGLSGVTVEDVAQGARHGDVLDPVHQPQLLDRREDRLRLPGRRSRSRPLRMDKPEDLETLPLESVNPLVNLMIRDVATVRTGRAARRVSTATCRSAT